MALMQTVIGSWIHGADPLKILDFKQSLKRLKELFADRNVAQTAIKQRIQHYFFDNKHRVTFVMEPSNEYNKELQVKEKNKLDALVQNLSIKDKTQIFNECQQLVKLQEEKEGNIECLPTLSVSDIPLIGKSFATKTLTVSKGNNVLVQTRQTSTNGVTYFKLRKSLNHVPRHLIPYLSILCNSLTSLGTSNRSLEQLDKEIKLCCGGISVSIDSFTRLDSDVQVIVSILCQF